MTVVRPRRISCIIHIHFVKSFKNDESAKNFIVRLGKYVESESNKIPQLNLTEKKYSGIDVVETTNNQLKIGVSKEFIDILIKGKDVIKEQNVLDRLLNRIMNFLNVSENSVEDVFIHYSKVLHINDSPIARFFDKSAVAEFSTKIKKSFYPSGVILTSKTDEIDFTLMLEEEHDNVLLEISQDSLHAGIPLDVLKHSNETINKSKALLLNTLGVSEK